MAARLEAMGVDKYRGLTRKSGKRFVWTGKVRLDESALAIPRSWSKPRLVFVNSMSDLFHEAVPEEFVARVWSVMEVTPRHTYQILTKRPDRMARIVRTLPQLPNVWLGASVEGPDVIDRIEHLKKIPAAVRFISFEPLIAAVGNIDLTDIHWAIVGGESGPRARTISEDWVEEIQEECERAGTTFFFKQWGGLNKKKSGRTYRGRTWDDLPEVRI
jgi:protein gp37